MFLPKQTAFTAAALFSVFVPETQKHEEEKTKNQPLKNAATCCDSPVAAEAFGLAKLARLEEVGIFLWAGLRTTGSGRRQRACGGAVRWAGLAVPCWRPPPTLSPLVAVQGRLLRWSAWNKPSGGAG